MSQAAAPSPRPSAQTPVLERRHARPHLPLVLVIERRQREALPIGALSHDGAPGVDDHGVPVAAAPARMRWTLHNLVAHPVGEVHFLLTGRRGFGDWFHDITLPPEESAQACANWDWDWFDIDFGFEDVEEAA